MTDLHPQLGSLLAGRYRLLRIVGEGGMGVVFEAVHTLTEKKVALKWLHARLAGNAEACQRLVREALATCRVSHPNVVEIYDVVQDGDAVFLVMELLLGESLEELLKRGDTPLHELVALLLPAMQGVAEAHRQGVIHRDIHPANIFLARRPGDLGAVPKVLDFGISKLRGDESLSLTRVGTTLGTPHYMSYEQLCNARDVDERTDVYSFAVILYRAATGRPPFEGNSFTELAIKIGSATPAPPKSVRADIPSSLERLILWAMSRDRDARIGSMEAFIRELEPFAKEHSFNALMSEPDRSVPLALASPALASVPAPAGEPVAERSSTRAWGVGAALLALVCLAFAGVTRWPKDEVDLTSQADQGQHATERRGQLARSVRDAATLPEPAAPLVEQLADPTVDHAVPVPMVLETAALTEPLPSVEEGLPDGLEDDAFVKRAAVNPETGHASSPTRESATRTSAKAQHTPSVRETTSLRPAASPALPSGEGTGRLYRAGPLRRTDVLMPR